METLSSDRINQIISESLSEELRKFIHEDMRHANCFGVRGNLVEFRESEREGILIVEERSVAAFEFHDTIQQINEFINWLLQEGRTGDFQIDINEIESFSINLTTGLILQIQFTDNHPEKAEYIDKYTIVRNGKVERIGIYLLINPLCHNQSLLTQYLFHELNHCKDDIERILNDKPSLGEKTYGKNSLVKYQEAYLGADEGDSIPYLIYNIFVDTELNAYTAQFYGELEHSNPNREQFHNYFKNSLAYRKYDGMMGIVEKLENSADWEQKALSYFNKKFYTIESFRRWFLIRANDRLRNRFKELCKVASLYYDTKEAKATN